MTNSEAADAAIEHFVAALREGFGDDLRSVVLFGSAAEDRLRSTSDVNVIVVLRRFESARAAAVGDAARLARAAVRLAPMFLLESEIGEASADFAVKFADVLRRRRVVFGDDPFMDLGITRDAELRRLRQVLMNLVLRLRESLVLAPPDRLPMVLADSAGPLRASAASLRALSGEVALAPREALAKLASDLAIPNAQDALALVSAVREGGAAPAAEVREALSTVIEIARAMHVRAVRLAERAS